MGNTYLSFEKKRRDIVKTFPDNKIISFPQSVSFEDTELGKQEFKNSIEIYKNHQNLTIFFREENSFNIMKEHLTNIFLTPDTVMYLANKIENIPYKKRDKIIICFRDDREKVTPNNITKECIEFLSENKYNDIELLDTHLGEVKVKPNEKEDIFKTIINKFSLGKVIITDRLHGVIFALITKTPCIALENSNKTWLKNIPYIEFLENYNKEKLIEKINYLYNFDTSNINTNFDLEFKPLLDSLKEQK